MSLTSCAPGGRRGGQNIGQILPYFDSVAAGGICVSQTCLVNSINFMHQWFDKCNFLYIVVMVVIVL